MLDHFWVLVHTHTFSHFSRRQSPERAKSPDLRDERAPPDGGPIVRTLPVLGERTEYVRSAGGSTLGRCVQHTRGYAEVGLEHRLEHRHAASEGSSGLWRVGVKNCGALEHRCERTTSSGSADTMATMLDHFWTHTHTYNAVILSAESTGSRCKWCCLRYERTLPDGSPFMCTRLVLAEGTEYARFAAGCT